MLLLTIIISRNRSVLHVVICRWAFLQAASAATATAPWAAAYHQLASCLGGPQRLVHHQQQGVVPEVRGCVRLVGEREEEEQQYCRREARCHTTAHASTTGTLTGGAMVQVL
jgi:hypothetical protein